MKLPFLILVLLIANLTFADFVSNKEKVYAKHVKDYFEIYTSLQLPINPKTKYKVIYYFDANLKSGIALRQIINMPYYKSKLDQYIFIGVAHIGNFHILRRRDFILPFIKGNDTFAKHENYGHTEQFYQFLKTELMPKVNKKYNTDNSKNSIMGHSLSALFVIYCLFRNENLFKNYFALSPALWIDKYAIFRFNKLSKNSLKPSYLYISTGGLEILNHIRTGTNRMYRFLKFKNYSNLKFEYQIHHMKTHNSQVIYSYQHMFKVLLQ